MVTQDVGACGLAALTPHRWLRSLSELAHSAGRGNSLRPALQRHGLFKLVKLGGIVSLQLKVTHP